MCGRYASTKSTAALAAEFDAVDGAGGKAPLPDHNVAPTKPVFSVVDRGERTVEVMRWGLIPHWAADRKIGAKMINARAESAATKPAFRNSLNKRRCLLPADGWFEWCRDPGGKQPFFMTRRDNASLAMAGIFSTWRDPNAADDEPPLITCAVLTTEAVGVLTEIHERMPLLLPPDVWSTWLDCSSHDVSRLLVPPTEELVDQLELRPVSNSVNSVRNNGPDLVRRAEPAVQLDDPSLFEHRP